MTVGSPGDFGKACRFPGCTRAAAGGVTGLCRSHAQRAYTRGTSDGRSSGRHPKLTADQVAEARRMRSAFKTLAEIARNFGVDVSTVRGYLRGDVKPRQP